MASGSRTLKDAINEAMRDWVTNVAETHYVLGTVTGPHPFPTMVREFHKVIGEEARQQVLDLTGRLPDALCACVGGGSNALGLFNAFLDDANVALYGFEAGGRWCGHCDATLRASVGVRLACCTVRARIACRTRWVRPSKVTPSLRAWTTPAWGPQHAWLHETGRASYLP